MTKGEHKLLGKILGGRDPLASVISWWKSKAPKRRPISSRKIEKKQERLIKKGARADVRAACVARSNGYCEACMNNGQHAYTANPLEMDHFYGRAFSESVETCWMLGRSCHEAKTRNWPSRQFWDRTFAIHCKRHGYPLPRKRFFKEIKPARRSSLSAASDMGSAALTIDGRSLSLESK